MEVRKEAYGFQKRKIFFIIKYKKILSAGVGMIRPLLKIMVAVVKVTFTETTSS